MHEENAWQISLQIFRCVRSRVRVCTSKKARGKSIWISTQLLWSDCTASPMHRKVLRMISQSIQIKSTCVRVSVKRCKYPKSSPTSTVSIIFPIHYCSIDGHGQESMNPHMFRQYRVRQATWECNPGTGNAPAFLSLLVVTHWKSLALPSRCKRRWHRPSSPPNRPRSDL